ncbi:hypothetical protein [Mesorhizobium sp. M7A.F.Ca.US.010.02.1.1]|uniref:hypothetical protein n=1 Tax=unclassified Mesorhizobium TaxID=325217 RepID=UPI000FD1EEAC|nr:hypothetical protein [Mesorhizobium sp. M7A.F.Ca.US.010.02.1.1]RUW93553.1 hypothetical protein EOA19_05645 [Mesorhizobium sp. M7A.F.Ca.US.010.02.1.1]
MAELTGAGAIEIIPIHFDVPEHHLELKTFIETAAQTELIIAGLNEYLFEGRLEYQVLVLPPEIGTFKTRLAIAAATAATISWGAVESDIGAAFIKGLTGHEPVYWSELAGGYVGELLADEMKVPPSATDARIECRTGALILSESTKSFLQKDVSELNKIGIRPTQFREGYEARNKFYEACAADTKIQGVGFTDADEFPIRRGDFGRLHVALPPKEKDLDDRPWHVAIDTVKVTSPNWERGDKQRQWKGRDSSGHERLFRIEDEQFWHLVTNQKLNPHIFDTIKVQWAFRSEMGKLKDTRVLRVLEYNENTLAPPLDGNALDALLGQYGDMVGSAAGSGGLFDRL